MRNILRTFLLFLRLLLLIVAGVVETIGTIDKKSSLGRDMQMHEGENNRGRDFSCAKIMRRKRKKVLYIASYNFRQ
ncbi:unnamed protein product [Amoebophrya sp. A25]|nr:unnamed protein product [Amoebophrya sp. A25]|eukprot:GSA25T00017787001.1